MHTAAPSNGKIDEQKTKYSNESVKAKVIRDFLPPPDELAAVERAWLEEVQRRSAEFDAGRMKTIPAKGAFKRVRSRLKK